METNCNRLRRSYHPGHHLGHRHIHHEGCCYNHEEGSHHRHRHHRRLRVPMLCQLEWYGHQICGTDQLCGARSFVRILGTREDGTQIRKKNNYLLNLVHAGDSGLGLSIGLEANEAKSAAASSVAVLNDHLRVGQKEADLNYS